MLILKIGLDQRHGLRWNDLVEGGVQFPAQDLRIRRNGDDGGEHQHGRKQAEDARVCRGLGIGEVVVRHPLP